MSGNQIRAARALLGWTQAELGTAAGLSVPTIKRSEGQSKASASDDAIAAIRAVLEAAGVQFIEENGGGAGVRLRDASK